VDEIGRSFYISTARDPIFYTHVINIDTGVAADPLSFKSPYNPHVYTPTLNKDGSRCLLSFQGQTSHGVCVDPVTSTIRSPAIISTTIPDTINNVWLTIPPLATGTSLINGTAGTGASSDGFLFIQTRRPTTQLIK
jgi:hypothetical protein